MDELFKLEKNEIAREILAYLSDHPDAADTLDGIVQWWLPEQKIRYQESEVDTALEYLVRQGFLSARKDKNHVLHYIKKTRTKSGVKPSRLHGEK